MKRFQHFIFLLVGLGLVLALAILISSNSRSERRLAEELEAERVKVLDMFKNHVDRVRLAQMVVERQVTAGDNSILETTLLWFPMTLDQHGDIHRAAPRRITIPGNRIFVDGLHLRFLPDATFLQDAVPGIDFLKGHELWLFHSVYGKDQPPANREILAGLGRVPAGLAANPQRPNSLENNIWTAIWDMENNSRRAQRAGLEFEHLPPASCDLFLGVFYELSVSSEGVKIRTPDTKNATELLDEAKRRPPKD